MISSTLSGKDNSHCRKNQFVFVGRLDKLKGIDLLLQTWQMLGNQFSTLVICGTGTMDSWCKEFIEENNIHNVKLMGFVPGEKVKRIISESKALILPTQCYEGFPMTIVEAYSEGTPVIGSNIGNVAGLILEGITGLTFEYNDELSLKRVVSNFSNQEWDGIKQYYKEHFGEEKNYDMLALIYDEVYG